MNRRRALGWLGAVASLAVTRPGALWADSPDEMAARAQELLGAGNTAGALELLRAAAARDPRNDRVQALLGRTWFQQGDAVRALEHFQTAVRLNPEDTLSRMMVETIGQFPVPARPASGKEAGRGRPASSMAAAAEEERRALLAPDAAAERSGPFRLLIDAGHGGADPGAPGEGPREADVTLDLALRLARILAATPDAVAISLTRTADVTLPGWARAALAGFYGADLLLSLHATRLTDPRASGMLVCSLGHVATDPVVRTVAEVENAAYGRQGFMWGSGEREYFAAAARQAAGDGRASRGAALAGSMARTLPGGAPIASRGSAAGPFRLLAEARAPALFVEVGFLSHPGDRSALASPEKRQALARSLAAAVLAGIGTVGRGATG